MSVIILEAMDKKQVTALVFLDLSKAFDSIKLSILLRKLRGLGLSRDATEWFRSCNQLELGAYYRSRVLCHMASHKARFEHGR